ncbi:uncharacterized protein BDV14DRAFT_191416 [Aspergillus stella-maris]|uniref:uncharacterized protein n=1 Tax=Aspergillus stella-maris TaxID=1810926 RepID=UPI003CCE14FC
MVVLPVVNNAQKSILGVSAVFIVLPCVAVALRVYGRRLKGVPLDMSDYLIMGGLVRSLLGVLNCGVGYHMIEVIQEHGTGPVILFMKELVAIQILWAVGNSCVKLSLVSFYCRVFSFPYFILMAKATATFIILWALAVILGGFLLCQPFAYTWDQSIPGGHCGNQVVSYQITGALNLVTDLMVLTMPMPYLWKLEMRISQKLPLIAVFAIGLFVCVATIMRLVSLSLLDFNDLTFNITDALIWGTIEPALGVTLACIPFMKPVFPFTRSMARYTTYSSTDSSSARDPGRKIFQHPRDPYPIHTVVSAMGMETTTCGSSPSPSVDGRSDQDTLVSRAFSEREKGLSIIVQREFQMS